MLAGNSASVACELAGGDFGAEPGDRFGRLPAHRSQPYAGRADG